MHPQPSDLKPHPILNCCIGNILFLQLLLYIYTAIKETEILRVSNELCVPIQKKSRCELAHIRDFFWMGTYGECRDRLIAQVSFLLNSALTFDHRISC